MDPYQTIGVAKDCSQEDISRAYRELALTHHPDHGGDENLFRQITAAIEIIGDPDTRARFDQHGSTADPNKLRDDQIRKTIAVLSQAIFSNRAHPNPIRSLLAKIDLDRQVAKGHIQEATRDKDQITTRLDRFLAQNQDVDSEAKEIITESLRTLLQQIQDAIETHEQTIETATLALTYLNGLTYKPT